MQEALLATNTVWVHLASITYVIGFWVRDQLRLRAVVLIGTVFYMIYYYQAAAVPLWSAIFWSAILGVVNLYVSIQLALERTTWRMSQDERTLYCAFSSMTPGEFRRLIDKAKWRRSEHPTLLTSEGARNRSLFYIVDGHIHLTKGRRSFDMTAGTFVGEVSYLLKSQATATAYAGKNTRYIEWRHDDLAEIERRSPSIRIAFREILNVDLAAKLAERTGAPCACETFDERRHDLAWPEPKENVISL